ncbi:uncharacterized protein LOC125236136 [Leguminivora glycinivorella]|uniref:uncharacterized protein LOC125236136 n=1 Tax=Leguminivora glycinivorella TaxID=1035111 RepID=UPI00200F0EB7|nr:uncharacterized protein LOC125236136 [Leguminivora glycinivorella]
MKQRGPYSPYLGSSTPEKIMKPKLSVISPNPAVKSVMKLYYIQSYLERMNPQSNLIDLIKQMIANKLAGLPEIFSTEPISRWCGINYGGSYEHRFRASSQKRSALYALSTTLATHISINTNQLGQALRGQEDYNLFFQELFLYIQNYAAEAATCDARIPEEYGVPLMCPQCTYLITDPQVQMERSPNIGVAREIEYNPCYLLDGDRERNIRDCVAAMSVDLGRKLANTLDRHTDVHDEKESIGLSKTNDCTDRLASNLMTEFRSASLPYLIVGLMQGSVDLTNYLHGKTFVYPKGMFDHLAYLILNGGRENEVIRWLQIPPLKHAIFTQPRSLSGVLAESVKKHITEHARDYYEATLTIFFASDTLGYQQHVWNLYLKKYLDMTTTMSKFEKAGALSVTRVHEQGARRWLDLCPVVALNGYSNFYGFDQAIAILVWRDLKGEFTEHLSPALPLADTIDQKLSTKANISRLTSGFLAYPARKSPCYAFSESILRRTGSDNAASLPRPADTPEASRPREPSSLPGPGEPGSNGPVAAPADHRATDSHRGTNATTGRTTASNDGTGNPAAQHTSTDHAVYKGT